MITDASSTTRRRFLSAAGVGAVSAMRTPPSATADDGSRGYDLITVPPNTREEIVIAEDEVFENKLIDITAPGSDLIIKAHEPNYTIRNVGVRGEKSTHASQGYLVHCTPGGVGSNARIENCYFGDGNPTDEEKDSSCIYVGRGGGTLTLDRIYVGNWGGPGVYASDMGQPDAGIFHGSPNDGTLLVENSYFENNEVAHVRLGTSTSRAVNCVAVGGPHRGFWAYWNHPAFVDCDSSVGGRSFEVGEPIHDDIRENPVRMTLENCRAEGGVEGVSVRGDSSYVGIPDPNPRTTPPTGVPRSPVAAASTGPSPEPDTSKRTPERELLVTLPSVAVSYALFGAMAAAVLLLLVVLYVRSTSGE